MTIGSDELVLAEVRPDATSTGDELRFRLDDVVAIDWGNDYLTAVAQLVVAG